jgi:hypothetical protein
MGVGNLPIDGGNYLFSDLEKEEFIQSEPGSKKYFRKWLGSDEFLNGWNRWCLYVKNVEPVDLKALPKVLERIENVRQFRLRSEREATKKLAQTPTVFSFENISESDFLIIPKVSSERRHYIPMAFESSNTLASDLVFIIKNAQLYHFGVLESKMHMAWMRILAGRLKSDFRYSNSLVYNNFPWPESASEASRPEMKEKIEAAAQAVLDARAEFPNSSLADLYDPRTMPPVLQKAHQTLDRLVDQAYGYKDTGSESDRIAFLFKLYKKCISE